MEDSIKKFDNVLNSVCKKIRLVLQNLPSSIKFQAQEIRIRSNRCVCVLGCMGTFFLKESGGYCSQIPSNPLIATSGDLSDCFKLMCDYSIYSFQNQIKNGFITIQGGNRIGICGTAVLDGNNISTIKNISSINIRIAKETKGCAKKIFETIKNENSGILIAGPPECGKTTVLRDLARLISSSPPFKKVTIVDERSEIAADFKGTSQYDVGLCDILTSFEKNEGILRAIRCLSPETIICDEIGSEKDAQALKQCLNAGVRIIASIHAANPTELFRRTQSKKILSSGAFEKVIFLKNSFSPGTVSEICKVSDIYDKNRRNGNFSNFRSSCGIGGI